MASQYPTSSSKYYDGNFSQWAKEGYDLAKTTVYPGVTAGKALSDTYVANADKAIRSRMMYGSRRLANLIKSIYSTANEEEEPFDAFNFLQWDRIILHHLIFVKFWKMPSIGLVLIFK